MTGIKKKFFIKNKKLCTTWLSQYLYGKTIVIHRIKIKRKGVRLSLAFTKDKANKHTKKLSRSWPVSYSIKSLG